VAIERLLIANRGEIAIRIARTAADMQMGSVAVYAEDDALSRHVRQADQAVALRGSGVKAYLDIEQLIAAARQNGCDAIHPGYGFLSENAQFSRRCEEEGICFVGPSAELLELLGDKARARQMAEDAGTPLARGLNKSCSLDEVTEFFDALGDDAAVMVKALAGGGGRGMRSVRERSQLEAAYERCREEARIAFGSADVYVEQFIGHARHIEIQILGDGTGKAAHAWERECTLQRRNQKLLEIAPSPTLNDETRTPIIEAALRLASMVKYRGLGTFEFLLDADDPTRYYFMEINPRLQVEHTVTEEITGVDLVRAQIELADGRSLGELGLDSELPRRGFAIQARINLEKMLGDGSTRPATGIIQAYDRPGGHGIRIDDHIYTGYEVNPRYDSLAGKVIVSSNDYASALRKIYRCLRELRLEGVSSNRGLLLNLVSRPEVIANTVSTAFVEDCIAPLLVASSHDDLYFGADAGGTARAAGVVAPEGCEAIASPTAGTLVAMSVATGDEVHAGQVVGRVEAMKMEFSIEATIDGVVAEVLVAQTGSVVDEGQILAVIEPGEFSGVRGISEEARDLDHVRADLAETLSRHENILDAARPGAVQRRRAEGRRTARENVDDLLDEGSFNEYGAMAVAAQRQKYSEQELREISPADGQIVGTGQVNSDRFPPMAARCAVMAYDYTVMAGTQGFMNHKKTDRMLALVKDLRLPLVFFAEGGGGRPHDTDFPAVAALDLHTFAAFGELSGLAPTVGIVAGNCFAGNAALYGLCDVTIATRASSIGMAGPPMIEGGGLGRFRPEDVGPPGVQSPNGVIDILAEDEAAAVAAARRYLSYFQGSVDDWEVDDQRRLRHLVPENRKQIYEVRAVIETLFDTGSVLELRREFARSAITALARIEGRPVGVIANDPAYLGGAIDADAGDKFSRFIQLCDAYDMPMVVLCDTPGFMVGPESEKNATVRHVARMFAAGANATIPVITVVLRKAYGLGAMAMAAGGFSCPILSASWPSGEFGAMGLDGAVRLSARRTLEAVENEVERQRLFEQLVARMHERGKALNVASFLEIDAVIDPLETRGWVSRALKVAPAPPMRDGKKRCFVDTW